MSVKQAFDSDFFGQDAGNEPGTSYTLNDVLVATPNQQVNIPMVINSDLEANTVQVDNLIANSFVYTDANQTLTGTQPQNYGYFIAASQAIPRLVNTPVLFNEYVPGYGMTNGLLSQPNGNFINTNTTRVLTCFISYTITFDADSDGSRGSSINYSGGGSVGGCLYQADNMNQGDEPTSLNGSSVLVLQPNQSFNVTCIQTRNDFEPLNISASIQVFGL